MKCQAGSCKVDDSNLMSVTRRRNEDTFTLVMLVFLFGMDG